MMKTPLALEAEGTRKSDRPAKRRRLRTVYECVDVLRRVLTHNFDDVLPHEVRLERDWSFDTVREFRGHIGIAREQVLGALGELEDVLDGRQNRRCACMSLIHIVRGVLCAVFEYVDKRLASAQGHGDGRLCKPPRQQSSTSTPYRRVVQDVSDMLRSVATEVDKRVAVLDRKQKPKPR